MLFSIFLCVLFRVNRFTLLPHNWLINTLSFRFWFLFRRIFYRFTVSWKTIMVRLETTDNEIHGLSTLHDIHYNTKNKQQTSCAI